MNTISNTCLRWAAPISLAVSIGLCPVALADPPINSTNTGADVNGGTYFNTPGSRTTFQNDGKAGLWIHSGSTVRGLESDAAGIPTGHGGVTYFRAPNGVVRIDGNIDVSALKNGSNYVGNGGKVFVDSAFLYQTGNIFANGIDGGLVQFNVESATIDKNARIQAMGFGGYGGQININATNEVNISQGALLDTSGQVISTYDTNVINIEGNVVNNRGILRANGIAGDDGHNGVNDKPFLALNPALKNAEIEPVSTSKGGTVRLVASGSQGNISNSGIIQANGSTANVPEFEEDDAPGIAGTLADGGTIIMAATHDINNSGILEANGGLGNASYLQNGENGGNGGTVSLNAFNNISNSGKISVNGGQILRESAVPIKDGGTGGIAAFSAKTMSSSGRIEANGGSGNLGGNGGKGGLIVFSTNQNPGSNGVLSANGGFGTQVGAAGTIVAPNPATLGLTQTIQAKAGGLGANRTIQQTRETELLINRDTALLLTRGGTTTSLTNRLSTALIRTVANPNGVSADPLSSLMFVGNFLVSNPNRLDLNSDIGSIPIDPKFFNTNTVTFLVNGNLSNSDAWIPGTHVVGPQFHDIWMSPGGGHMSLLASGDITNDGFLLVRGIGTGGSMNVWSGGGSITNNAFMMVIANNTHLLSAFVIDPSYVAAHGGSMIFKAGKDIVNNSTGFINNSQAFYPLHRQDTALAWPVYLNGAQIGANLKFFANRNFVNNGRISADALTYRREDSAAGFHGATSPANAIGGLLTVRTGGSIKNSGYMSALGDSYFGTSEEKYATTPSDVYRVTSSNGSINLFGANTTILNASKLEGTP